MEVAKLNKQSTSSTDLSREPMEEGRRSRLIEVTIDSLAELGYVGTTLAQIAGRAGVSPGLVAHYFGDKDGLLDAAFRSLTRRGGDAPGGASGAAKPRERAAAPAAGERFASINPANGEILGYAVVAGPAQIDAAVRAA